MIILPWLSSCYKTTLRGLIIKVVSQEGQIRYGNTGFVLWDCGIIIMTSLFLTLISEHTQRSTQALQYYKHEIIIAHLQYQQSKL